MISLSDYDWTGALARAFERRRRLCLKIQELGAQIERRHRDLENVNEVISDLKMRVAIEGERELS